MRGAVTDWHEELRDRGSVVRLPQITIPVAWIALLLSLLIHLAALLEFHPELKPLTADAPGKNEKAEPSTPLVARLGNPERRSIQATAPPQAPAVESRPAPAPAPPVIARPKPRLERPPSPPVAAAPSPFSVPVPSPAPPSEARVSPPAVTPPPQPEAPQQPQPPMAGDLASYIASRRRARGAAESAGSPDGSEESDIARRDRIVASNLASVNTRNFNDAPKNSGGVFQIQRIGYDDAEFTFFGWNRDIKRRANMKIEVRRSADDPDIQHAVVRKMIAIIREYEVEDFTWESLRLGRNVRLSARKSDNAELEAFLMREFFEVTRGP